MTDAQDAKPNNEGENKEALESKEIEEGKFFAVISYISFLCVVSLLLKKDNKFVLFHAKQGLVLFAFQVACLVLSIIPAIGPVIKLFGILIVFTISLRGIFQAMMSKYARIPLVSNIADKIVL